MVNCCNALNVKPWNISFQKFIVAKSKPPKLVSFIVIILALASFGFLILWHCLYFETPEIGQVTVQNSANLLKQPVHFPYMQNALPGEQFVYDVEVHFAQGQKGEFTIIPDDCVESIAVNDQYLLLNPEKHLCDYQKGFSINLGRYFHAGLNHVEIKVLNTGGPTGLNVKPLLDKEIFKTLVVLLLNIAMLFYLFTWLTIDGLTFAMVCAALFLTLVQFYTTGIMQYSYDIGGHVDYIRYVAEHWRLPEPYGWQNHQPPLYYGLAALAYKAAVALGVSDPATYGVRYVSLVLYIGFLTFGALTLLSVFVRGLPYYVSCAVWFFWPLGFTMAGRISNDIGIMFCLSGAFYFFQKWERGRDKNALSFAFIFCGLALACKGTAALFLTAMAVTLIYRIITKEVALRYFFKRNIIAGFVVLMAGFLLNFGRIAYYNLALHQKVNFFINVQDERGQPGLHVGNAAFNYLYFDLKNFIENGFTDSWSNNFGSRELFWNYFLKTLLFGEWHIWKLPGLGSIISALLVIMLAYVIFTQLYRYLWNEERIPQQFFSLVSSAVLLGGLMMARIGIPWAPNGDARYIYIILLPFVLLYGQTMEWHKNMGRQRLYYLGGATRFAFAFASFVFIALNIFLMSGL